MAKKNHNNLFVVLFLFIISSSILVLSFTFDDGLKATIQTKEVSPIEFFSERSLLQFASATLSSSTSVLSQSPFNVTSYTPIYVEEMVCPANFMLIYNNIEHDLDVNDNGYVCIRFSPIGADETNFTYITVLDEVKIGREKASDNTQLSDGTFESKLGLTKWVMNNQNDWVERLVNDNVNGTQFESGIFSYYYDKESCGMSIFDVGRISDEYSIPKIKFNGWVVKQALNGTDTWTDLPVNSEQCVVTVDDDNDHTMITAVRNDTNGILTETYDIPKPINKMKTTLTYINNDATKNGTHKFAFTNVLGDVPDHMTILLKNQTSFNATSGNIDYKYEHYSSSPNSVPIDYDVNNLTYINGTIDIPRSDFYIFDDIPTFNETGSLTTGFEMHYFSEEEQKDDRFSYYFIKDSMDKIWNIKLVNNGGINDIYIDYMNNATAVNLGESVTLDPSIVSQLAIQDTKQVEMTGRFQDGCATEAIFNFVTTIPSVGYLLLHIGGGSSGSRNTDCTTVILTYDISAIPDLASIEQIEFKYNVTALSFPNQWTNRWNFGISEPIAVGLTGADVARTVFADTQAPNFDTSQVNIDHLFNMEAFDINQAGGGQCTAAFGGVLDPSPCPYVSTFIDPSGVTDFFETVIEGGTDFMLLNSCGKNSAALGSTSSLCGNEYVSEINFQRQIFIDEATMEFNVQWIILTPTSEPLNVTCENIAGDNFVDWDLPLDLGGGLLEGFQIERDSGGGFAVIVADTGSALPTSFTDTTGIIQGLTFQYRITAINDQGLGVPSEPSNTCGLPEISGSPQITQLANVALNTVAIDWTASTFDGNTDPIGYKIDRVKEGDPPPSDDEWIWAINDDAQANNCGSDSMTGEFNLSDELAVDSGAPVGNRCIFLLMNSFDKEDVEGKEFRVTWQGSNTSPQLTASMLILDGEYFQSNLVDGQNLPTFGNGFLGSFSRQGSVFGGGCGATGLGVTDSITIDTSQAIDPSGKVTLAVRYQDFNLAVHGQQTVCFQQLEVTGMKLWNLTSTIPRQVLMTDGNGNPIVDLRPEAAFGRGTFTFQDVIEDGFTTLIADTGNILLQFLDTTVEQITTYGYRVSQINSEGISDPSNTAIIFTVGLPAPPINLTPIATGTRTIDVTWQDGALNGGDVAFYTLDRKTGLAGIFQTIFIDDVQILNDQFLNPDQEYCYRVKVTTQVGESSFTNEVCATTFDAPSEPLNMTATAIDGSSINVDWLTPDSDGGSIITGYKIERQKQSGVFELLFSERQPESNRILNDTNREVGTLYTYRVSAVNQFGDGDPALDSATTDATPQVPPNFVCNPVTNSAISLGWDTPLTFSAPSGYQIDRKIQGEPSFTTIVADTGTTATTFLDDGLPFDTIFVYRILGITTEGNTDFTPEVSCQTLQVPDSPPEDVQADFSEVVPHQTVLGWDIPDTFGIPINAFRIERDDGAGYSEIGSVSGSSFAFIDQALDNDDSQKYRIILESSEGDTVPSIAVPFDTNQTSHWHYENTPDDTGENKNTGSILGVAKFNGIGHIGKAFIFDGGTRIEVDSSQESDYDFERTQAFGITSYYQSEPETVADDEWQLREQQFNASFPPLITFLITPPLEIDGEFGSLQGGWVFKTFNKTDVINKQLDVTWATTFGAATGGAPCISNCVEIRVQDGSYDRNSFTDFPSPAGTATLNFAQKGGGELHLISRSATFSTLTDSFNMTLAGSTLSEVTVMIRQFDESAGSLNDIFMDVNEIEIGGGVGKWTWDSSSSVALEVTGTVDDRGLTFANATTFLTKAGSDDGIIVSKAQSLTDTGYKFFVDDGKPSVKLTNTDTTDEIFVQVNTDLADNTLHFVGFGYNGNSSASGVSFNIDGTPQITTIITDTLTSSILNNDALTIGGSSTGSDKLIGATLDETRIFGSGTLDEEQLEEIGNDEIESTAPINATFAIAGSTFANISSESPTIQLISGFPLPTTSLVELKNFTVTTVNTATPTLVFNPISGQAQVPPLFNFMGALSNYTAESLLTNPSGSFPILSNFDIQVPIFTFTGDFFFQQARDPTFTILSFNFTQTDVPFDLTCNFKSELFGNGTSVSFSDVFFVQTLVAVDPQLDVVVACIDPNAPVIDPTAPSFGGSNALLSFVSFGDTTGIGNFLNFTTNFGDFFGASLPFLFIIILAAAFTGRSAPTGIVIIGLALGIMWAMGILTLDPIMWGVIVGCS